MDAFMDYYFEEVFCNFDRDSLNERYKRRELVEYFNSVISGCAKGLYLCIHFTHTISVFQRTLKFNGVHSFIAEIKAKATHPFSQS